MLHSIVGNGCFYQREVELLHLRWTIYKHFGIKLLMVLEIIFFSHIVSLINSHTLAATNTTRWRVMACCRVCIARKSCVSYPSITNSPCWAVMSICGTIIIIDVIIASSTSGTNKVIMTPLKTSVIYLTACVYLPESFALAIPARHIINAVFLNIV